MNKSLKSKIVLKFFTQEDFAEAIGERPAVVSNVIRSRRKLSPHKKIQWAEALECSVNEIFPIDHEISEKDSRNTPYNCDSRSNQEEDSAYED
jgi:transcriptional regulator with XRE-family HTH domain